MKTITPDEMKSIEEGSETIGVSRVILMENAGHGVADLVRSRFRDLSSKKVVVVCGTGNNGGDGFVAARHLAPFCKKVHVILLGRVEGVKTHEASLNLKIVLNMKRSLKFFSVKNLEELEDVMTIVKDVDIIVDAIFGTGVRGPLREPYSSAIDLINKSKALKVAVDIPSGLDPLTGEVHGKAVKADVTITFHGMKEGLMKSRNPGEEVIIEPIGIPPEAEE